MKDFKKSYNFNLRADVQICHMLDLQFSMNGEMLQIIQIIIKWVPENMYTFSIAGHIVNVYKFSGTHFIISLHMQNVKVAFYWDVQL